MGWIIVNWLMVVVGAGSMVLGMVFGMIDTTLRFKGWLQRIAQSAPEGQLKGGKHGLDNQEVKDNPRHHR